MKKKKIILIAVAGVLVLIILAGIVMISSLMINFNRKAFEYQPPVERESEYVMPAYPEITLDTEGIWQENSDETLEEETETEPETETETETVPETEKQTEETETEPETKKETAAETIAPVINKPAAGNTYTPNKNASFGNTEKTVSVYGSVPIYKVKQKNADIKNYLIIGTDSRDVTVDRGRSDTMIVVSYNEKTGSVKLISLLRDSLVPIEGRGWNRLNTAYVFGGIGLTINTINQLYDLDIQDFIVIDFNGVKDFINYTGGFDLYLTEEEAALYTTQAGREIKPGINHMRGNLALLHMRNRKIGNDFGRTQRQRDVITAMVTQILAEKSVVEIYDIVDYGFSLIRTNISATGLVSLATSLLSNASKLNIETENVPFSDAYKFGWYKNLAIISFDIESAAERINAFIYE